MKGFSRACGSVLLIFAAASGRAQNTLYIPPTLSGTTFNLNVQSGTTTFFPGFNTPTFGINGVWMSPTLILNKGDSVTLNVTNNLNQTTTMHWHGLHVPAKWDGGPHQIINAGATWSPRIKVMNDAATYWYHPHGENKTEAHVSKGLAGLIIVKDAAEAALTLPRTYGVDDFPIIVQSKAFDVLKQIAIATQDDSTIMVNGTMQPYLNAPAQVIRMRLLNGSSMRSFFFGFTGNLPFKMIGTDDGLLDSAVTLTRLRLSPGERAEIVINLTGKQSQTIYLRNFGSQLPAGIHGAAIVGGGASALPDYNLNPRNGGDYDILKLNVVAQTSSPVTTMPTMLIPHTPLQASSANNIRTILMDVEQPFDSAKLTEGPMTFNGESFDMMKVNDTTYLNRTEIWRLINKTQIAHPFHIHDVFFDVLDINGQPPSVYERGKKDVVLVMPGDTLRFITKFEDFADATVPYMYHCHLLHHEDDGMMGAFLVLSAPAATPTIQSMGMGIVIYPNPAANSVTIQLPKDLGIDGAKLTVSDVLGKTVHEQRIAGQRISLKIDSWHDGLYTITVTGFSFHFSQKLSIQKL